MFSFRNNDNGDPDPEARQQALQQVSDSLTALVSTLEERHFAYEDRQQIAAAISSLLATGHEVTDEATVFEWVPPDSHPSSDELAMELRSLVSGLDPSTLPASTTSDDLMKLVEQVHTVHDAIRDAPEFPYAITEVDIQHEHRKPVRSLGVPTDYPDDDPDPFAGPRARKQIETVPRENPEDAPLFVGTGTNKGRDASIPRSSLFEHSYVVGLTGTGKSTYMTNALKQVVEWGYGACYIDPKGDDSRRVMRILPEHRLDDVVWVEPSSTSGYVSGFNFIDVGLPTDHPLYSIALTNVIEDLVKLLGAGDYWGPRMNRVARNLIRAMNEYNRLSGDAEPDLTLVDLYYVLSSRASREEFAARVTEAGMPFVQDYTQEIAEMPDDDLEPLLGRFLPWVQDDVVRRMIGFREGGVDIPKAIREGKIIIVRMGAENRELKRMLGMAIIRRIWAQIRARSEQDERDREPFFLIADEFDNLAVADETIPTMFSESRSYRLSITAGNQYPGQLPQEVVDGMTTNSKSILSFNPGDKKQAKRYRNQLGIDAETLTSEADYHLWMRVDDDDNYERSDAFRVYTHPPFPPYRTTDETEEIITERIKEYGREQPTAFEQQQELLFNNGDGNLETGIGADIQRAVEANADDERIHMLKLDLQAAVRDSLPEHMIDSGAVSPADEDAPTPDVDTDDDVDPSPTTISDDARPENAPVDVNGYDPDSEGPTAHPASAAANNSHDAGDDSPLADRERDLILESIFAARIQADLKAGAREPGRWVPLDDATRELRIRLSDSDTLGASLSETAQAYEIIGDDYAETGRVSGKSQARLTDKGRTELFRQDTGSSGSGGSMKHRLVLRGVYSAFTALGYITSLPEQEGEEMPDGLAKSPITPADKQTMDAIETARDELKSEYPAVWELSKGQDVSIEAETTTQTYPHQTFRNLRKAIEKNHRCVYATQDGESEHGDFAHWARRIAKVHYRASPDDDLQFGTLTLTERETDDGTELFYSAGKDYTVTVSGEEKKAVRPTPDRVDDVPDNAGATKWYRDLDTGEIAMAYAVNRAVQSEAVRFPDADSVTEEGAAYAPAYYEYDRTDDEYIVYTSDGEKKHYGTQEQFEQQWETFTAPFIPDIEFPREPTEDDFAIIIIPDEDSSKDQPHLYTHGEVSPLYDELDVSNTGLGAPQLDSPASDGSRDDDAAPEPDADREPAPPTPPQDAAPAADHSPADAPVEPDGSGVDTDADADAGTSTEANVDGAADGQPHPAQDHRHPHEADEAGETGDESQDTTPADPTDEQTETSADAASTSEESPDQRNGTPNSFDPDFQFDFVSTSDPAPENTTQQPSDAPGTPPSTEQQARHTEHDTSTDTQLAENTDSRLTDQSADDDSAENGIDNSSEAGALDPPIVNAIQIAVEKAARLSQHDSNSHTLNTLPPEVFIAGASSGRHPGRGDGGNATADGTPPNDTTDGSVADEHQGDDGGSDNQKESRDNEGLPEFPDHFDAA